MTYLAYKEFYDELDKIDKVEKNTPIYTWMFIVIKDNKICQTVACITGCDNRREENSKTYYIYGEHTKIALKDSFIKEENNILACTYGDIHIHMTEDELKDIMFIGSPIENSNF